jgi:formylglycine-generating enzyme required for sulfatase activity
MTLKRIANLRATGLFTPGALALSLLAGIAGGQQVLAPAPGQTRDNARDGQRYVWAPPGKFTMGCSPLDKYCATDENPAHPVEITRGFWIGQTPVTVAAWKRYRTATGKPALLAADEFGRKLNEAAAETTQPAVAATWDEAKDYCSWAGLRLPTEAEWEYAARAGSNASRYGEVDDVAWYGDNSGKKPIDSAGLFREDPPKYDKRLFSNGNGPRGVTQKKPNAWGLYDILGNVWEWVADYYSANYYGSSPAADPPGPAEGTQRVLRGGAWNTLPNNIRVSYRLTNPPGDRINTFGFRCAGDLR